MSKNYQRQLVSRGWRCLVRAFATAHYQKSRHCDAGSNDGLIFFLFQLPPSLDGWGKNIIGYHRKMYLNFFKILEMMLKIDPKKTKLLRGLIDETKYLAEREWLF